MPTSPAIAPVVHFYETHSINEGQILARLRAAEVDLDGLTEEVLKDYDQDHFGGLEAVDRGTSAQAARRALARDHVLKQREAR